MRPFQRLLPHSSTNQKTLMSWFYGFSYMSMWGRRGAREFSLSLFLFGFVWFHSLSVICDWSSFLTCSWLPSLPLFNASFFLCLHSCQWIMIRPYLSKILTMSLQYMYVFTSYVMFFVLNCITTIHMMSLKDYHGFLRFLRNSMLWKKVDSRINWHNSGSSDYDGGLSLLWIVKFHNTYCHSFDLVYYLGKTKTERLCLYIT